MIDFTSGNDHTNLLVLVGQQSQKRFFCAQPLSFDDLRLFGYQRNDAHGGKSCAHFHRIVVRQSADGDVSDGVDLLQKLGIHPEHTSLVGKEEHLSLGRFRVMGTLYWSHGGHPSGAVILVDLSCVFFPDEDMLFSDAQHMVNVFFPDDVSPLEGHTLETIVHFRDVVAQLHADCVLHIDFFHVRLPLLCYSFRSSSASGGREIPISSLRICFQVSLSISQPMRLALFPCVGFSMMV